MLVFPSSERKTSFLKHQIKLVSLSSKVINLFQGYNHVAWEEGKARSIYAEDAKLFEERILVRSFTKPIPVGSYVFSFSYVVPEFLPSSFSVDGAKSLKWEDIALREASVSGNGKSHLVPHESC